MIGDHAMLRSAFSAAVQAIEASTIRLCAAACGVVLVAEVLIRVFFGCLDDPVKLRLGDLARRLRGAGAIPPRRVAALLILLLYRRGCPSSPLLPISFLSFLFLSPYLSNPFHSLFHPNAGHHQAGSINLSSASVILSL